MQIFTRRRWLIAGSLFVALALAVGTFAIADAQLYVTAPTRVAIEATPIASFDDRDPSQMRFGALEFRGGLALTAKIDAFGGISAIHIEPDGAHFIAVTDRGSWLRGRIVYKDGKPAGIADAEMAPILGADGKPIKVPAEFKTFTKNKSLECLAAPPKGAAHGGELIAVTEESLDAAGNFRSFLLDNDGHAAPFTVKRSGGFDISDCTVLPPGDLLLLERSFSPVRGVAVRIRRVPLRNIKAGALVDGAPLIEADLAFQIDNMEGAAVHRTARGETVLTLVSDDNFSPIQRNLLLQFTLQ